jgi:thioredoxin reductase (NADPH)
MQERAFSNKQISFIWDSEVKEIRGSRDKGVTGIRLANEKTGAETEFSCEGVFIAIGHEPSTVPFKGQLEMDERGYIASKDFPKTSVDGVFVAGDAFDHRFRQAVTAAGDGCKAALAAEQYLQGLIT